MEYSFNICKILPSQISMVSADVDCSALVVEEIGGNSIVDYSRSNWSHKLAFASHKMTHEWKNNQIKLSEILDNLGKQSGIAQGLMSPVTSATSVINSNHRVYILRKEQEGRALIVGILKVGHKALFLFNESGDLVEKPDCLCLLDFYVVESEQHKGYGFMLFQEMLKVEDYDPRHIAYDAPSPKLFKFLEKYYNLRDPIPQATHIAVFKEFFVDSEPGKERHPGYKHEKKVKSPYGKVRKSKGSESPVVSPLEGWVVRRRRTDSSAAASCLIWDTPDDPNVNGIFKIGEKSPLKNVSPACSKETNENACRENCDVGGSDCHSFVTAITCQGSESQSNLEAVDVSMVED